jgi:iron-sulfur cluster repair protein YtfE (RIC family)
LRIGLEVRAVSCCESGDGRTASSCHTCGVTIVRLGEKRDDREGDVVDALLACHRRIRSFLALAARVGQGGDPAQQVAEACAQIGRYFREAMPLHVADEEESILPRLVGRAGAVDDALAAMQEQHTAHEAHLAELAAAVADPGARAGVAAAAAALEQVLAPHLDLEEDIIFPGIRRLLSARELADIAAEMRARRG